MTTPSAEALDLTPDGLRARADRLEQLHPVDDAREFLLARRETVEALRALADRQAASAEAVQKAVRVYADEQRDDWSREQWSGITQFADEPGLADAILAAILPLPDPAGAPVAWMYERPNDDVYFWAQQNDERHDPANGWIETPLYARPLPDPAAFAAGRGYPSAHSALTTARSYVEQSALDGHPWAPSAVRMIDDALEGLRSLTSPAPAVTQGDVSALDELRTARDLIDDLRSGRRPAHDVDLAGVGFWLAGVDRLLERTPPAADQGEG